MLAPEQKLQITELLQHINQTQLEADDVHDAQERDRLNNNFEEGKRTIALALSNLINGHPKEASLCTTFMEKSFSEFASTRVGNDPQQHLNKVIYYLVIFSFEYYDKTKTVTKWMIDVYKYYSLKLAYKEFDTELLLKINRFTHIDCYSLFQQYESATTQLNNWAYKQKEELIDVLINKTKEVNALTTRVEALKSTLEKLHTEYNFVGLSHAFEKILSSKRIEKFINIFFLFLFGLVLLFVPAYEIYSSAQSFHANTSAVTGEASKDLAYYLIKFSPVVLFEALFIYFFRIVLHQFYSVKGQITQLQLRNALCMFIEKHAEFKEGKNEKLFEKFDALIFSPIVTKEDKIPSTLDGLEQLSKLLQPIKSKKE